MTRLIVYGLLLCLIILVAYGRFFAPDPAEVRAGGAVDPEVAPGQAPQVPGHAPLRETMPSLPGLTALPEASPSLAGQDGPFRDKYNAAARLFMAGDLASAQGLFRELAQQDKAYFKYEGASAFGLGNYPDAITALEQAAEHEPADFAVRKMLAVSYHKLDDPARGLAHSQKGLSIREDRELRQLHEKLARDLAAQKDFVRESSSHFTVLYDGYEHGRFDRDVLGLLEDAYATVGRELEVYPAGRVTVILYTDRDFFDTTQAPSWSGGIYDGKIRIPMRGALDNRPQLKMVLFHEYTHAAVHSIARGLPAWLNEGLADYYSRTYPGTCGQVVPLSRLEQSFLGLKGQGAAAAYWESYSAVSYLMDRYGAHRMRLMLESFGRNRDVQQAFQEAFGTTYREFLAEWGKT